MPILTDIELDEISLVDKGANPGAKIVFFKQEKAMNPEEILAALPEEQRAVLMEHIAALQAQIPAEPPPAEEEKAEEEEEKAEEPKEEEEKAEEEEDEEEKEKSAELSPDVQKRLEENTELRKRVLELEDNARTEEVRKRVEAELPHLPGITQSGAVSLLKAAGDALGKEEYEAIVSVLKSCSQALSKSVMFSERGTSSVETGTALERITSIAKKLRDSNPGMTLSKARLVASEEHPELFSQYLAETRKGA